MTTLEGQLLLKVTVDLGRAPVISHSRINQAYELIQGELFRAGWMDENNSALLQFYMEKKFIINRMNRHCYLRFVALSSQYQA